MSAPLLAVRLLPSRRLTLMLGFAHTAAIALLWPLAMPVTAKLAVAMVLVASLIFTLRQNALLLAPGSVVAFDLSDEMACTLETRRGQKIACALLGSSFVAPYLTVLNLKPEGKFLTRSVVILADSMDAEEFRQLRVLLRWKYREESSG